MAEFRKRFAGSLGPEPALGTRRHPLYARAEGPISRLAEPTPQKTDDLGLFSAQTIVLCIFAPARHSLHFSQI